MSNQRNKKKPEIDHDDPFASLFAKAEEFPRYWEELAKLEFTEKVLTRMKELSLNRTQLAELMKVQPSFITRILSGQNNFELGTMVKIARALKCEYRSHLQPVGTETMWINVLKQKPVSPTSEVGWDQENFSKLKLVKPHVAPHEPFPVAA